MDLRSQLQKTLGEGYTLERELEGGGMARVFVAREQQLGRERRDGVGTQHLERKLSSVLAIARTKHERSRPFANRLLDEVAIRERGTDALQDAHGGRRDPGLARGIYGTGRAFSH